MQKQDLNVWLRRVRWITAILILVLGVIWAIKSMQTPSGITKRAQLGGEFTLTDNTGKIVHYADFRGKPMLIYFGYAYCPDVCPTALHTMAVALDGLGADQSKLQPVFITVDPARDDVAALAEYVKSDGFPANLVGLTGTPEEITKAAAEWKVIYRKSEATKGQDAYLMDHSSIIYLMGSDGKFVAAFSHADTPDTITKCLRSVLADGSCRRS